MYKHTIYCLLIIGMMNLLCACGQSGPLYLPHPEEPPKQQNLHKEAIGP